MELKPVQSPSTVKLTQPLLMRYSGYDSGSK